LKKIRSFIEVYKKKNEGKAGNEHELLLHLKNLNLQAIKDTILAKAGLDKFDDPAESLFEGAISYFSQTDP